MKLCNPFNIRKTPANHWRGSFPTTNRNFVRFRSSVYSCRAFIIIIATYRLKYNITSIYDIIHRYAPPVENDTNAYIRFVCNHMKCLPDTNIDHENLYEFAKAVALMESNYDLSKDEYAVALSMTNY